MDFCKYLATFTFLCCVVLFLQHVEAGDGQKRLLQFLFDKKRADAHHLLERPVANEKEPLNVRVKFTITQLLDVDEKNQVTIVNIWLDMRWNDYHFRWNPDEYNGLRHINVNPNLVWKPDILLYNSANEKFDATFPVNVLIHFDGNVSYIPPGMFKSSCNIDIAWFPFDSQTCTLKFGSWTYHGSYIDLGLQCGETNNLPNNTNKTCMDHGDADLTSYRSNGEWALVGAPVKRNVEKYECCPEVYPDLKLELHLRRKPLYYVFNLIIPCCLISGMSLLVFALPPVGGQKISFGVTILLSLTMFLMLMSNYIPQTSTAVPLLGIYFVCIIVLCTLSLLFTVLGLSIHHNNSLGVPVPNIIRVYINTWLARAVFMQPFFQCAARLPGAAEVYAAAASKLHGAARHQEHQHQLSKYQSGRLKPGLTIPNSLEMCEVSTSHTADEQHHQNLMKWLTQPLHRSQNQAPPPLALPHQQEFRPQPLRNQAALPQPPPYSMVSQSNYSWLSRGGGTTANTFLRSSTISIDTLNEPAPPSNSVPGGLYALGRHSPAVGATTATTMTAMTTPHTQHVSIAQQHLDCSTKTQILCILQEMRYITRKMREDEDERLATREWTYAARVVDRFCFIVFSVLTLLVTVISIGAGYAYEPAFT